MTASRGVGSRAAGILRSGGQGFGLLAVAALLQIGVSLIAVMLVSLIKEAPVGLVAACKILISHLTETPFLAPIYATLFLLVSFWLLAAHQKRPSDTAPKLQDPHIAAFGIRPSDAEKEARKAKRGDKSLDILWNNHAHKMTIAYFVIGTILLGRTIFLTFQAAEPNVDNITAASSIVLFIGACIGSGIATWRGRQFERQTQYERFAQVIDMLAMVARRRQPGDLAQCRAAFILLNDLPRRFLFAKRKEISEILVELDNDIVKVMTTPSLHHSDLVQSLVGTRAQTVHFPLSSLDPSEER